MRTASPSASKRGKTVLGGGGGEWQGWSSWKPETIGPTIIPGSACAAASVGQPQPGPPPLSPLPRSEI